MGQAAAGLLTGVLLSAVGYQSAVKGEVITQSEETLNGIWMFSTLVPGLLLVGVALVLQFVYPLGKKAVDANVATLAVKREAMAATR